MDFKDLQADPTAEKEGTWIHFSEDTEFLIASANSPAYRKKVSKLTQREHSALRRNDIQALDRVTIGAMADGILLNWRGKVQYEGKDLPYSHDNAKKLLAIPVFREWVATQANDLSNFQTESEEAATGALKSGDAVGHPVGG